MGLRGLASDVVSGECDVEEQVQQWRAQSMHQLQELESMNQALRSTLNLHSCCAPLDSKEIKHHESEQQPISHKPSILISGEVGPNTNFPFNLKSKWKGSKQKTVDLVNVAEMRCKKLEEELELLKQRHVLLEHNLEASEKQVAELSVSKENNFSEHAQQSPNVDVGVCTQDDLLSANLQFHDLVTDLLTLFQAYEMELKTLASANLSDAEALTRQSEASNKLLSTWLKCHREQLENGVQEVQNDSDCKQELAVLSMEGTNYSTLSAFLRLREAAEDLEQKISHFDKSILQMVTSVKHFQTCSVSKVESLKMKVDELQAILVSQESMIASLQSEIIKRNDQINFIMDEKVVGEEALQASQLECIELASLIKEIDGSMVQLTTALATRTMERDQEAEARMNSEGVRLRYNNLMSELDGARAQRVKLQSELEQMKRQQEDDRNRMENAERDVEQLKSLIVQLDNTREELVVKLKAAMMEGELAEKRAGRLEIEIQRVTEVAGSHHAEVTHLCSLLEVLGAERDLLLSETNNQVDKIAHLNEDNKKLGAEVTFLRKNLQATEERLQATTSLLSQAEGELTALKEKFSVEEATKLRLEELWNAKSTEHRAAADELGNLTSEHQILTNDLIQLTSSHERLMENLRNLTNQLNHTEQVLYVKEKEHDELLTIYHKICEENQQLKRANFEIENEVQHQRYHLQGMEDMFHKAQEQARFLDQEIQRHVSELKAMERQADLMTRSLNQQSGLLNDYQNEKAALMAQLSAAKMAVTDLDAKLDNAVREIANVQGKNQHMSEQLQEHGQEVERLTASWKMEQERVGELEHLLACVRAEEQQLEMASKGTIEQNLMMKEHLCVLEEQVKTLKQTRDAQNQEIMRLQTFRARSEGEESRKFWSTGPSFSYSSQSVDTQPHQISKDVACSKAKILELEAKIISMTTDLSKTTVLYKDCFSKLQNAESQSLQLKKEFDHVLSLFSKVDEERSRLQLQCSELERASSKHQQLSCHSSPTQQVDPEIQKMQQECHRLKQEAATQETVSNVVARIA